jgi:hypothetical protein
VLQCLDLVEGLGVDQRLVDGFLGPDPLAGVVPLLLGGVAEGDVVDVDEQLGLGLLVPDLLSGVPRVGEDRANGAVGPGDPAAVRVALRVISGRARDVITGQSLGDGLQPIAGQVLGEDPPHHVRRTRVGASACSRLPSAALAGLGCGPRSTSMYP